MRQLLRVLAATMLLLIVATPALAQSRFVFTDETGDLNQGQIQRAAQPLLDRGAEVAVYFVQEGGGDQDFLNRLTQDGLVSGNSARARMIAIYVSTSPRYSSIRFGDGWNEALATNDNFDAIRQNVLNANLAEGDFNQAVTATFGAIDDAIANPPQVGGGIDFNVNFIPLVLGVFVLFGLIIAGRVFSSRRKTANTLRAARERMEKAREGAGTAIAQLGQAFRSAQDKAEFDRVSYSAQDVAQLTADQQAAAQRFVGVQTRFDDIGEQLNRYDKPTVAQYDEAAQAYAGLQPEAEQVSAQLAAVEARRVELDKLTQQAPQEVDRLKKA